MQPRSTPELWRHHSTQGFSFGSVPGARVEGKGNFYVCVYIHTHIHNVYIEKPVLAG